MKVKDLIEALKHVPGEAEVAIHEGYGYVSRRGIKLTEWHTFEENEGQFTHFDPTEFTEENWPEALYYFVILEQG
jgi:hypothetical protein